jgi:hypothetical protein
VKEILWQSIEILEEKLTTIEDKAKAWYEAHGINPQ